MFNGVEGLVGVEVLVDIEPGVMDLGVVVHAERNRLDTDIIEKILECRLITSSYLLIIQG